MPKEKKTKEKKTKVKKVKDKKSKVKTYNFLIKNPSPLSRRQEALRQIKSMTNLHSRAKSNPKRLAAHLDVSQDEADTVIMELANAGYIQIGLEQSFFGNIVRWTNPLTITPGKDVTAFLDGKEEQQVKKEEPTGESTSKGAEETPQKADP